jgi:DUF917 family protein
MTRSHRVTEQTSLSSQDLDDVLDGACILGAGGGGPYSLARQLRDDIVSTGKPVVLAAPATIPDDARAAVSAGVGSPIAASAGFPFDAATRAFERLDAIQQQQSGRPFTHVLPAEIGAANSLLPMTVAVSRGLPIVDGAGSSRAVPALPMSTYAARGAPVGTVVLANASEWLNFDAQSPSAADSALRGIISTGTFKEDAGVALWAMDGETVRQAVVPGTTTLARRLGEALRTALGAGDDPVEAVAGFLQGRVLFRGTIASVSEQTIDGFDVGTLVFSNGKETFTVVNQNENIVAWSDRRSHPVALAPDLICYLTADGKPFSNADLDIPGHDVVVVIGAPVDKAMRAPAIVEAFDPALRRAGYGGPYMTIEELWGAATPSSSS